VFLKTLDRRELRCGYAEMIKHALISGGEAWAEQAATNTSECPSGEQVLGSIAVKHGFVSRDPLERDLRKALNFGHTIGHAVETALLSTQGRAIGHGEAVAVGLVAETWLSKKLAGLSSAEADEICEYITKEYPPIDVTRISKQRFIGALLQDKKNAGGTVRASLIQGIGTCIVDVPVEANLCWKSLEFYTAIHAKQGGSTRAPL
jgi:3-dehydroquinate synthase